MDDYNNDDYTPTKFRMPQESMAELEERARVLLLEIKLAEIEERRGDETAQMLATSLRDSLAYEAEDETETLRHQAKTLDLAFRRLMADADRKPDMVPLYGAALKAQHQYRAAITTMKWLESTKPPASSPQSRTEEIDTAQSEKVHIRPLLSAPPSITRDTPFSSSPHAPGQENSANKLME